MYQGQHDSIHFSIETEEKGYRVTRTKTFFSQFDKAILMTVADEITKHLKPTADKYTIDIIGHGKQNYFTEESIFRIIVNCGYGEILYKIVNWRDSKNGTGECFEYQNMTELKQAVKKELAHLADRIYYA